MKRVVVIGEAAGVPEALREALGEDVEVVEASDAAPGDTGVVQHSGAAELRDRMPWFPAAAMQALGMAAAALAGPTFAAPSAARSQDPWEGPGRVGRTFDDRCQERERAHRRDAAKAARKARKAQRRHR